MLASLRDGGWSCRWGRWRWEAGGWEAGGAGRSEPGDNGGWTQGVVMPIKEMVSERGMEFRGSRSGEMGVGFQMTGDGFEWRYNLEIS